TFTAAPGLLVNRTYKIRVTMAALNTAGLPPASQYTSTTGFATGSPNLCDGSLVISQVYGGGGNASSVYRNDFIEILNRGSTSIPRTGYSVQYAPAAGTSWSVTPLTNVTLQPGQYYLIQEASNGSGTTSLPAPDATGTINLSATAGKVAL